MDTMELMQKKFQAIGARIKVSRFESRFRRPFGAQINIGTDRKGEFFDLQLGEGEVELQVIDCRSEDRHLLMLVKAGNNKADLADRNNWTKLLCGHDERHWFVAGVDTAAADVPRAKDALKPDTVIESETRHNVGARDRHSRKNAAFVRQGEWFFVPVKSLEVDENMVFRKEPLRRGRSKPHVVDELYRCGGATVHVCSRYPDGLTDAQYREALIAEPGLKRLPWQVMTRDAEVCARGRVRHPDHKTVVLKGWHRVYLSEEVSGGGMINGSDMVTNAFLD